MSNFTQDTNHLAVPLWLVPPLVQNARSDVCYSSPLF